MAWKIILQGISTGLLVYAASQKRLMIEIEEYGNLSPTIPRS